MYAAAGRILAQRMRTGQFDPLETTPPELLALGAGDIGTPANAAATSEGMTQGLVLLRNNARVLPLSPGKRLAVLGPTGNSTARGAWNAPHWLLTMGNSFVRGVFYFCPDALLHLTRCQHRLWQNPLALGDAPDLA